MSLTREDKIWLCKLATVSVRIIVAALIGETKTQIAMDGVNRMKRLSLSDDPNRDFDDEGYKITVRQEK